MSNLACIGMALDSDEEFQALLGAVADSAEADVPPTGGFEHSLWRDDSGAAIAFHSSKNEIECITPFFVPASPSVWRVRTTAASLDGGCMHCSGADCDVLDEANTMTTRVAVQWLHFQPYANWLGQEHTFDLQVVGFAGGLRTYPDEAAFDAGVTELWNDGDEDKPGLAPNAFLPNGLFAPGEAGMTERARAMFVGTIADSQTLINTRTDGQFCHLVVDTLPGRIDVVCEPDTLDGDVAPGYLAWVDAWIVGRPMAPPPPPKPPGLLRRMFG